MERKMQRCSIIKK